MGGVSLKEGPVAVLSRAVEVVVALDELAELLLNVSQLGFGKLVLVRLDLCLLQITQKAELVLKEKQEGAALTFSTAGGPADPVDVVLRVIWRVVLDDPVDLREV